MTKDLDGEIWKDIIGWPFHQVSNKGRVRALPGAFVRNKQINIRSNSENSGVIGPTMGT
jgi:hypothetical protein